MPEEVLVGAALKYKVKVVVPREIQFADFNLDGHLDIFIIDQGYDDTPEMAYHHNLGQL